MTGNRNSLKTHLVRSWFLLGAGALLSSVAVLAVLLTIDYANQIARIRDDLAIKGASIARRLSGELLIGPSGTADAVSLDLIEYHGVSKIQLLPIGETCAAPETGFCRSLTAHDVYRVETIPAVVPTRSVMITVPKPTWAGSFRWGFLLIGGLPVLVMTGIGILLQWRFMRKQLLHPIAQLIESQGHEAESLPLELQRIADRLSSVLEERDQANALLHRAEAKMQAQEILGRFLSSVLHDISTPIASAGMLVDQCPEMPVQRKDEFRRIIGRIRGIVSEHRQKLNQVGADSPLLKNSDLRSDQAVCSAGGVTRVIADEFAPRLSDLGIHLTLDVPARSLTRFAAISYSDLSRVISNLLENAVLAAAEHDKRILLRVSTTSTSCELTIRDFGIGFDPAILARLEAGERCTTRASGTGQGLFSARKLIEAASGQLRVLPQADGSLILITLPLASPPAWFSDPTRMLPGQSILALDDDLTLHERLKAAFPDRSIELFQTEDEFLQRARSNPDPLLLVDYNFGGLRTGLRLIEDEKLQGRAVLLSGRISFDEEIQARATQAGVRMCPKECIV